MTPDIKGADCANYPQALAAMEAVMQREAFTYREVHEAGDSALRAEGVKGRTCYRWADRLLQQKRRAGAIRLLPGRQGWTVLP